MQKLGISVDEQKMMNNVAMDIVVDSVSVYNIQENISRKVFMSISEAIKEHPELVRKYLEPFPQKIILLQIESAVL
jgi:Fe-S cluster assembly protein SufB